MNDDMKRELDGLKSDLSGVKTDVSVLKADLSAVKTDVAVLKTDVSVIKTDVSGLKSDVSDLKDIYRGLAKSVARLTGDFVDFKREVMTKNEFSVLMKRMDGFTDILQDSRWDWGKQKVRLDDHEKRISKLEAKRA